LKRLLLPTKAFEPSARRLLDRNPSLAADLEIALDLLSEDAFHPKLKTHKLKGKLMRSWAASVGYDLRIVFQFVTHKDTGAIL
jgi:mRNA-degrading endonuclease YafQ of YafQ-DinJ toxin-antitoxin module